MDLTCKPRQQPGYRLEKLDDELLLYNPGQTTILYCNPSASLVWQLCDGQRTVEEMVDLLAAAYEQPVEAVRADTVAILAEFQRRGAVEYTDRDRG